jgi:hypothetical protein
VAVPPMVLLGRSGGSPTLSQKSGAGYFRQRRARLAPPKRRTNSPKELNSSLVAKVTTTLETLYPSRVRGRNCRRQPEGILQETIKMARSQGLRLGWRKFLRYLTWYQPDVLSWGPGEIEVAKALQCAVLRGRNFARCRLIHDTFRRNALLHMLESRKKFLPNSALPKQMSNHHPLGFWANRPQLTLVKLLAKNEFLKYEAKCLAVSKKKKGKEKKFPILSFRSFGTQCSYSGTWEILPRRSKYGGPTLVEFRQGQDPRLRTVTSRDLRGLPRRRHNKRQTREKRSRAESYTQYNAEDFDPPEKWFS